MKKLLLFCIFIFAISHVAQSQMTLEHTYYNSTYLQSTSNSAPMVVANLLLHGKKLVHESMRNYKIDIYNLDYTLWTTINLPTVTNSRPQNVYYVSENLFKIDNQVDMAVCFRDTIVGTYTQLVIDQAGTIIDSFYNSPGITIYNTGSGTSTDTFKAVVMRNTGFYQNMDTTVVEVYSLPGTIPCNSCNSNSLGIGYTKGVNSGGYLSEPIPNPNNGSVRIDYTLPQDDNSGEIVFYNISGQVVKSYTVYNTSSYLFISDLHLPAGSYYYSLLANKLPVTSKKMIVVD